MPFATSDYVIIFNNINYKYLKECTITVRMLLAIYYKYFEQIINVLNG